MSRPPSSCIGLLLIGLSAAADAGASAAPSDPCLRLETKLGALLIRLDRAAAPNAVATIERLARGPIYDLDLLPRPEAAKGAGYFEGLAFDYTRPHAEIRLASRRPEAAFLVEAELDGVALGLDRDLVADVGQAMDVMQRELVPTLTRPTSERRPTPQLEEWVRRFREGSYDPAFLVGKSRLELLEAVGYRFRSGLASKPVTRGSVALVPESPTDARMSLAFAVADLPQRNGRWVVVGQLLEGQELVDSIALSVHAAPQLRDQRPQDAVTVDRSELIASCNPTSQGGLP